MMAQDDPAAGIRNWEEKFWSLDGLLDKKAPVKKAAKQDNSYLDEATKEANDSFRKDDEKRRGTTLKESSSNGGKRRSKRKSMQRKPSYGK